MKRRLSVQSYCYRGFKDNEKTASLIRETGLDGVELCGVHVDFQNPATFAGVIETYRKAGISIVSIGVSGISGDEKKDRNIFQFAKQAGCTTISVNFSPDVIPATFDLACGLAREYGVKMGIHNHGGKHWLGNTQMLKHIFSKTGKELGLMLDTAWALDAGENPVTMAETFRERLVGLHLKDFTFGPDRKPKDVVVGQGNLDLKKMFALLDGFNGNLILEYEGDVENPVPALQACVKSIQEA